MHRFIVRITLAAVVLSLALASAGALTAAPPSAYTVTPLVSDVPGAAAATDPNLVNGWGRARSATSPWWVADNGAGDGKSTLYTGAGAIIPLVVNVAGGPTGAVFAGVADNFLVATDADPTLARASFIFDNEDGNILAWRGGGTALVTAHGGDGAIYKGLAIAQDTFGSFAGDLLVGNFGDGQINAYAENADGDFEHRGTLTGADGKKLAIDGLWALEFGNAGNNGTPNQLFFSAGPDDESHGL